jgi:hypothetical protein
MKEKKAAASIIDDCERPACDDMISMYKQAAAAAADKKKASLNMPAADGSSSATNPVECPPTSVTLGNASWTLLHTMVRQLTTAMVYSERQTQRVHIPVLFSYMCTVSTRLLGIQRYPLLLNKFRCYTFIRPWHAFIHVPGVLVIFRRN